MEMSEEEKESIEILGNFEPDDLIECAIYRNALKKINSLIENLQKEIELKDKVIDKMARNIIDAETYIVSTTGMYAEFQGATPEYVINTYINEVKED